MPYHKFGELIGFNGIYVDDPDRSARRGTSRWHRIVPWLLEVKTDPEVPPLPPHFTFAQIENFMKTLAKGDERKGGIIRNSARQIVGAVLPGSKTRD